ncbi:hypothetical protein V1522DRAFT_438228 [Lipomyces starkeyi]
MATTTSQSASKSQSRPAKSAMKRPGNSSKTASPQSSNSATSTPDVTTTTKMTFTEPGITPDRMELVSKLVSAPVNFPMSVLTSELLVTGPLIDTTDYVSRKRKISAPVYYADVIGLYTPEESGIYEFGPTVYGTAKLYIDGELVVDNETVQVAGDTVFGAGTVEEKGTISLVAGKTRAMSKIVEIVIELKRATSFWDETAKAWISEKDTYDVLVGTSSADIKLNSQFKTEKPYWWNGL